MWPPSSALTSVTSLRSGLGSLYLPSWVLVGVAPSSGSWPLAPFMWGWVLWRWLHLAPFMWGWGSFLVHLLFDFFRLQVVSESWRRTKHELLCMSARNYLEQSRSTKSHAHICSRKRCERVLSKKVLMADHQPLTTARRYS